MVQARLTLLLASALAGMAGSATNAAVEAASSTARMRARRGPIIVLPPECRTERHLVASRRRRQITGDSDYSRQVQTCAGVRVDDEPSGPGRTSIGIKS